MDRAYVLARLARASFPRAAAQDPSWLLEDMMGPCSVWLAEALGARMQVAPRSSVVDIGCGKAMSSLFLAREFDVDVTAVDLWIDASDNQQRIADAGLADRVRAVHADAMNLDLPPETFDALVSIDAFHYFADQPASVEALTRLVRPGGQLGVVVPGLRDDLGWPEHLAQWRDSFLTFHGPDWWEALWRQDQTVQIDEVTSIPWGGSDDWICWADACDDWARLHDREPYEHEARMLRQDHGGFLVFHLITANKL